MSEPAPRSLPIRLRLAIGYALFLVGVVVALGFYLLASLESNLQREADESLALRASQIEREVTSAERKDLTPGTAPAALLEVEPLAEFAAPGIYVQVLDQEGRVFAHSSNLPEGQLPVRSGMIEEALAGQAGYATVPAGRERVRVLAHPIRGQDGMMGVVLVGESLRLTDLTLRRMQQLLVIAAATSAMAALLGGWWLTGRALGPMAGVTHVARKIAETGQFERRIASPPAQDEIGELVATFNDMLSRLERTVVRQREFLADASHELRGPLMVIRGNLDLLKLDLPSEDRRESVREATEEVERMARLVSDLLFLSEVDAQEVVQRRPVALDELVAEVLERARQVDGEAHHLRLERNDPVSVLGDRDRLRQLLWNLVENALRYTPAGGQVTFKLSSNGHVAEIAIADTGIGISAEHLPHVFERFYRVDRARSRTKGGTGLGLAIVKQVAEAHRGEVRVRSVPSEGSTFTVSLPIREPRS